jgi:hypothetical protein
LGRPESLQGDQDYIFIFDHEEDVVDANPDLAVLGKTQMSARQVSTRGGDLGCALADDRVKIGGRAAK